VDSGCEHLARMVGIAPFVGWWFSVCVDVQFQSYFLAFGFVL
jgi:hypothetical protein